ncbi:MAG TPA: cyclic nucleotide-binding domain-containing protein [Acidimicrobiia bacterium]|nr:cyclic nucleotide-binding domain-containing protein [Acidimicrobiia bacterium]
MPYSYALAETAEDQEAVYRFRYSVYVEELGRYQGTADHEHRRLVEPEDQHSLVFLARDGDDVVATVRLTLGEMGFSDRQVDQYRLQAFLDEIPLHHLAVGERAMVEPSRRGTGLLEELVAHGQSYVDEHDLRLIFGACEPHLLSLYLGMGQRTYADRNINSAEAGYLIPLVSFPKGIDALVGTGHRPADPPALPGCVERIVTSTGGAVRSPIVLGSVVYSDELHQALSQLEHRGIAAFDGFDDDEIERCIARSNIIECDAGDRLLKEGGSSHNLFVVLDGNLEVRDHERPVGVVSCGEIFGEVAFLLDQPRSVDVYAATDGTRVLSLSEGTLRKMIAEDSPVAAKLMLNTSKMLCMRLIRADQLARLGEPGVPAGPA